MLFFRSVLIVNPRRGHAVYILVARAQPYLSFLYFVSWVFIPLPPPVTPRPRPPSSAVHVMSVSNHLKKVHRREKYNVFLPVSRLPHAARGHRGRARALATCQGIPLSNRDDKGLPSALGLVEVAVGVLRVAGWRAVDYLTPRRGRNNRLMVCRAPGFTTVAGSFLKMVCTRSCMYSCAGGLGVCGREG